MLKKAMAGMLATCASANINVEFEEILTGQMELTNDNYEPLWNHFVAEFSEVSPVELGDAERLWVLFDNIDSVIKHNLNPAKTYTRGINKFSAMTFDEFAEYFHLEENQANAEQNCSATGRTSPLTAEGDDSAPDSWNWVNKGGVSPVKDQGNCGSCWTFSTVGCLESAHLINFGYLTTYAEQQLVDCAGDFDNNGCNGGLPSHAFEYIFSAGGISTEEDYPYYAEDRTCTVDPTTFKLSVGHSVNITALDETELKSAVY